MLKNFTTRILLLIAIGMLIFLSSPAAEDWTQLGFGGLQAFRFDEQYTIGAMGLMNIELKHTHPKAWFSHFSRFGVLAAFEYESRESILSGTIQLSLFSFWISNQTLLQLSAGPFWTDAIGAEPGGSAMLLMHFNSNFDSHINSGSVFLRADVANGGRGSIGISIGHSILERFSD